MKKTLKILACLSTACVVATTAFAADVELYALDGRTINVDESEVPAYTKAGMGWYEEKPVTLYSEDGRTTVVPADAVEANKEVGWYLKEELDALKNSQESDGEKENTIPSVEDIKDEEEAKTDKSSVRVKYTDGTIVTVPAVYAEVYKALGWSLTEEADSDIPEKPQTVTMYNSEGVAKEVKLDEVAKYELEGWSKTKPEEEKVLLYRYDGASQEVPVASLETYKALGWYPAYDEAVYAFAAFGDGGENPGTVKLLEQKKYELAFTTVQSALDKLSDINSEYVTMLYYLRSNVTDSWREAANSPLGFVNYWFVDKDNSQYTVIQYRNVSNSRIVSYKVQFEICDAEGNVIDSYISKIARADDLQLSPCETVNRAWKVDSTAKAASIKNLKVLEVEFSDGTTWLPSASV